MSKRPPRQNNAESKLVRALDTRALLDDISTLVHPILLRAMREHWTPEQWKNDPILRNLMYAKKYSIAIMEPDASRALAAIKDIEDRTEGKAVERSETTHKYEKLKDEELDALLMSEEKSLERDTEKH